MAKSPKADKTAKPDKTAAEAGDVPQIDIGLSAGDRRKIADGLSHFLADSYTLYLKTHNFHWNITGPMFNSLHVMFEGQYTEAWTALDAVAERIRALGYRAPGSYAEFAKLNPPRRDYQDYWASKQADEDMKHMPQSMSDFFRAFYYTKGGE